MKLLGFEGHEIISINYQIVSNEEIQEQLNDEEAFSQKELDGIENILVREEVAVKMGENVNRTLVKGRVFILDLEGNKKIELEIVGEFSFDSEGETNSKIISDYIFENYWPMLKKYISPAIATITSITNGGEIEIDL